MFQFVTLKNEATIFSLNTFKQFAVVRNITDLVFFLLVCLLIIYSKILHIC